MDELTFLREEITALKLKVERAEAVNEIQRLMATYFNMHVNNPDPKFAGMTQWDSWKLWADRPDSSVEITSNGLYVGFDNIKAFYERGRPNGPVPISVESGYRPIEIEHHLTGGRGMMFIHTLCSPMIVVAEDGQTARGLWESPGNETCDPPVPDGVFNASNVQGEWVHGRVHADFIKENGGWKIWHYRYYRVFRAPYGTCWTDMDQRGQGVQAPVCEDKLLVKLGGDPSRVFPTTYWHTYSRDDFSEPVPFCPQPYETWTDDRFPV